MTISEFRVKKGGVPDPVYVNNPDDIGDSVSTSLSTTRIPVGVAEDPTDTVDLFLVRHDASFTLSANSTIFSRTIVATAGHGIVAGNTICLKEATYYYQGAVLNVSTNTITLDSPLDYAFTTACVASRGITNMNVNGSVTPQMFKVSPLGLQDGILWHINRIIVVITDGAPMDDSLFGGIAALTNGVVLRLVNGHSHNMFNIKSNGDWALRAYDVSYSDKAPAGSHGIRIRSSFNGADKRGTPLPITAATGGQDRLEVVIQDDLTGLDTFRMVAQGHRVYGD